MLDFVLSYYSNTWFFWTHMVVWVYSFYFLLRLWARGGELSLEKTVPSDKRMEQIVASISELDDKFDLCSTCFILVGLVGTIYGFVQAVPMLRTGDKAAFVDLGRALSTSGFGIAFSIVLSVASSTLRARWVMKHLSALKASQNDDHPDKMTLLVGKLTGDLAAKMDESFIKFSGAIGQFTNSMDRLTDASRSSTDTMNMLAAGTTENIHKVDQILECSLGMPQAIADRLTQVFDQASASLDESARKFSRAIENIENLPRTIHDSLQSTFNVQIAELEALAQEYRKSSGQLQVEVLSTVEQARTQIQESSEEQKKHAEAIAAAYEKSSRELQHRAVSSIEEIQRRVSESFQLQLDQIGIVTKKYQEEIVKLQADLVGTIKQAILPIEDALKRVEEVPSVVAARSKEVGELYQKLLAEEHLTMAEELRKIAKEQAATLINVTNILLKQTEVLDTKWFTNQKMALEAAITECFSKVTAAITQFKSELDQQQTAIPEDIKKAQQEVIARTVECAQNVRLCADALTAQAENMPSTLEQLRSNLAQFQGECMRLERSANTIANAADSFTKFRVYASTQSNIQSDMSVRTVIAPQGGSKDEHIERRPQFFVMVWMTRLKARLVKPPKP